MQFRAQAQYYRDHYPNTSDDVMSSIDDRPGTRSSWSSPTARTVRPAPRRMRMVLGEAEGLEVGS
jgi:hypothetical protein